MVTLCASRDRVDGAACLGRLVEALAGIGADLRRMVLDLDCTPYPAPANAVAAVDAWAAEREVTVVALGLTPSYRLGGVRWPGAPVLRAALAGLARGDTGGMGDKELAPLRQLRRAFGARALVQLAAGIRQAHHQGVLTGAGAVPFRR
ncbi:hypothetical protein ABZ557_31805 [Streptomyces sp. NPDC019645]|uniref:hypothetical protein n=1 Tax=Streptomyces sp. NPDC019645 TaxID=3154786 RepID=UPI0033CE24FF